jgi:MFS superfamily sulfate permease-like transporter
MNKKLFAHLKSDIPSGIVVFLVATPLCLGIALASGAPFFSGMIAGIVGGIVIGSLSNSQLSVSGPAAGLAALVFSTILQLGAFETFLLAVMVAGVVQFLLGLLKAGAIANYFPSSVIKGMLSAIGVLIIAKQIPHAFGYDTNAKGDLTQLFPFGDETMGEFLKPLQHIDAGATFMTLLAISIMLVWERPFIKKRVKHIPGALVAVVVCVLLNQLFLYTGSLFSVSGTHMVKIPVAESPQAFFNLFTLPDFSQWNNPQVYTAGIIIALIASIETLLCIEAVDKLDPERRTTSTNRELKAQGVGNMLSGLIGGLPVTSVIVRSSANIGANAKTKMSAIIHGVLLLGCTVLIPGLLNKIPLAALAAILLITGYKLCKISVFKDMFAQGKYQWVPFMVTIVSIVAIDLLGVYKPLKGFGLLTGVGIGLLAGAISILMGNLKNSYFFHKEQHHDGETIYIRLAEEVSFLNKAGIKLTLSHLPENATVVIDASGTFYIDYDVLEIIREFRKINAPLRNIKCVTVGFKEKYKIDNTHMVQSIDGLPGSEQYQAAIVNRATPVQVFN